MKRIEIPPPIERDTLLQSPPEVLVDLILAQQKIIEQLVEEIERLKQRGNSDSQSSSKPPSSDVHKRSEKQPAPAEPDGTKGEPKKRKAGGQPGHEGKTRKGFGRVDRLEVLRERVLSSVRGTAFAVEPLRMRHQAVAQLVERPIEVVEYQQHSCECACCGAVVSGGLPESVVEGQSLRASLQALLVWDGNYGHLSYEKQQELLLELGGIEVGTGTLQATNARMAQQVDSLVQDLGTWVKAQPHVHVDESPWLVKGVKEWMWVIAGVGFVLFHAADTRGRSELEQLLGKSFAGCLSSDD